MQHQEEKIVLLHSLCPFVYCPFFSLIRISWRRPFSFQATNTLGYCSVLSEIEFGQSNFRRCHHSFVRICLARRVAPASRFRWDSKNKEPQYSIVVVQCHKVPCILLIIAQPVDWLVSEKKRITLWLSNHTRAYAISTNIKVGSFPTLDSPFFLV